MTSEWQPIETARRDGWPVLVTYRHAGRWIFRLAKLQFHMTEPGGVPMGRWLTVPGDWHIAPTYWMSLPEPPIAQTETAAALSRNVPA